MEPSGVLTRSNRNAEPDEGESGKATVRPANTGARPRQVRQRYTVDDFAVGKQIGEGKYGRVFRVKRIKAAKATKIMVMKTISKAEVAEDGVVHQLRREVEIHSRCRHRNIVKFMCYFYDDERAYLILEWCNGGNLYERRLAQPDQRFGERQAAIYLRQVMSALLYLRESKAVPIIHRDIKPENILLQVDKKTGEETLKLADFGWAVQHVPTSVRTTLCGTPEYLPPEVVANERYAGSFDMWTLGVLLYEMITGTTPFAAPPGGSAQDATPEATMERIREGKFKFPDCSVGARDLMRRLLEVDPERRARLRDVIAHPWIMDHCGRPADMEGTPALDMPEVDEEMGVACDQQPGAAAAGGGAPQ